MATFDEESVNYYRTSTLIKDIGTSLLLRILKNEIKPLTLDQFLGEPDIKTKLHLLKKQKALDSNQYSIVTVIPVSEDKFDISLIVKLLLNVCPNVVPPGKSKNYNPPDHDLSLVADLNRLRYIRNELLHRSRAKLSKDKFIDTWAMVKRILLRMSKGIGETGNDVKKEINDLLESKLDPSGLEDKCQVLITDLKKWREDDERTYDNFSEILLSIKGSVENSQEKVGTRQSGKELQELYHQLNTLLQSQGIEQITLDKDLPAQQMFNSLLEHIKRLNEMAVSPDSDQPKCLKELLSRNGEITMTSNLPLKILSTKEPIPYKNYRGDDAIMKRMIVADGTAFTEAIAYDSRIYEQLTENEAIIASNIIKRSDGTLVFTSWTKVFATSPKMVIVPEEIQQKATSIKLVTLSDASNSALYSIVSVQGKVVKAATTSSKRLSSGEVVPFKRLKLKDHSGTMDVTLWRELANDRVVKSNHVQLKNFCVVFRYYETRNTTVSFLTNQREGNSSIKVITDPDSDDDVSSDCSDFEETDSPKISGKLMALQPIKHYKCCTNPVCWEKKLQEPELNCPTCLEQYSESSAGTGFYVKLLIMSDGDKDDHGTQYTVFKDVLTHFLKSEAILKKHELMPENVHHIMSEIKEGLPKEVNFIVGRDGEILKLLEASTLSGE